MLHIDDSFVSFIGNLIILSLVLHLDHLLVHHMSAKFMIDFGKSRFLGRFVGDLILKFYVFVILLMISSII